MLVAARHGAHERTTVRRERHPERVVEKIDRFRWCVGAPLRTKCGRDDARTSFRRAPKYAQKAVLIGISGDFKSERFHGFSMKTLVFARFRFHASFPKLVCSACYTFSSVLFHQVPFRRPGRFFFADRPRPASLDSKKPPLESANASLGACTRKAFDTAQKNDARGRGAAARVLRDARGGRVRKRMG